MTTNEYRTFNEAPADGSFRLSATPVHFRLSARFATEAGAQEFAAQLPKGIRARATTLSTCQDGKWVVLGLVVIEASLSANGVNGGVNETGARRYRAARKAFAKLGTPVRYELAWANSFPTVEAFEAWLASPDNKKED